MKVKLSIFLIVITFISCRKVNEMKPLLPLNDEISFYAKIPVAATLFSNYSIRDESEAMVRSLDVLAFRVNDLGMASETEVFAYRVPGEIMSNKYDGGIIFKAKLQKDGNSYRFLVVANARSIIESFQFIPGSDKNAILKTLVYTKKGKWNAATNEFFDALPMSGISAVFTMNSNASVVIPLSLTRGVVSINVLPTSRVDLRSVELYNTKSSGFIFSRGDTEIAALPTNGVLKYLRPEHVLQDGYFKNLIYTFESSRQEVGGETATALVVGVFYGFEVNYYRIDLIDAKGAALPILRNCKFNIEIDGVEASGYPDPQSAWDNEPVNLKVRTTVENEVDQSMNHIVSNGATFIQVDATSLTFMKNEPTKILNINSNYSKALIISCDADWLTLKVERVGPGKRIVKIVLKDEAKSFRSANIIIKAGYVVEKVSIVQRYDD